MPSSSSETPHCQTDSGPTLNPEFPLIPLFRFAGPLLIVGPSDATKAVGKAKQEFAERHDIRRDFWTGLLEYSRTKTKLHSAISPSRYGWIGTGAGKAGLGLNYVVWEHEASVELYINRAKAENKAIFDVLQKNKIELEKSFGDNLEWERLDSKQASRIRKILSLGGWKDPEKWGEIHAAMVDAMIRLEKALRPYIQKLEIETV